MEEHRSVSRWWTVWQLVPVHFWIRTIFPIRTSRTNRKHTIPIIIDAPSRVFSTGPNYASYPVPYQPIPVIWMRLDLAPLVTVLKFCSTINTFPRFLYPLSPHQASQGHHNPQPYCPNPVWLRRSHYPRMEPPIPLWTWDSQTVWSHRYPRWSQQPIFYRPVFQLQWQWTLRPACQQFYHIWHSIYWNHFIRMHHTRSIRISPDKLVSLPRPHCTWAHWMHNCSCKTGPHLIHILWWLLGRRYVCSFKDDITVTTTTSSKSITATSTDSTSDATNITANSTIDIMTGDLIVFGWK